MSQKHWPAGVGAPARPEAKSCATPTLSTIEAAGQRDELTGVRACRLLTKQHTYEGGGWSSEPYDKAFRVSVSTIPFVGLPGLHDALADLARDPHAAVVRGTLAPGVDGRWCLRRFKQAPYTFLPMPRLWLMADVDALAEPAGATMATDPERCALHARRSLPPAFRKIACVWQASASAGIKPGVRVHLWFVLDRPVDDAEARTLLKGYADTSPLHPVGLHYVADPIFVGAADPMPRRLGMLAGRHDVVEVPDRLAPAERRTAARDGAIVPAPVFSGVVSDEGRRAVKAAFANSRTLRDIAAGRRSYPDRSTRHYAVACALFREFVCDFDAIAAVCFEVDQRLGLHTDKIMRPGYAARTIAAALAEVAR